MKIGIDYRGALDERKTGVGVYISNLVDALAEIDTKNEYILYVDRRPKRGLNWRNFSYRYIRFPRLLWSKIGLSLDWLRFKPDLFFFPGASWPLFCPIKTVATIHDLTFLKFPTRRTWDRWRLEYSYRQQATKTARIIVDSQKTKKDLLEYYQIPPSKIEVIYLGCDPIFQPVTDKRKFKALQLKYHLPDDYLIYVGVLTPHKNVSGLLRAFKILKEKYLIEEKLLLVGPKRWNWQEVMATYNCLNLKDSVKFMEYLPRSEMPVLLSFAKCLVMPSFYEGFGLPVLEAMACGTAVACSQAGSLPEVAGEAAVYFDPHQTESISQAILALLEDEKLRQNYRQLGQQQAEKFSYLKTAKQTLAVFTSMAGTNR